MQPPQFQGYQSEKHQADAAFVAKWGKRIILLWLGFLGVGAVLLLLVFLTVGGCVAAVATVGAKANGATTEAETERERQAIHRQLNAVKRPVIPQVSIAPVPVESQVAEVLEERIHGDTKSSVDRALKRLDEQRRADYQGFPGKYDADPHPWKRSK